MLLRQVKQARPEVDLRWSYFSLTQVNDTREGWTVWEAPEDEVVRGRLGFKAAEASRRQDRFDAFHQALLTAHHEDRMDLEDIDTIRHGADQAGLDWTRMVADMADPTILAGLARDHQRATTELGVFGTPTFVFAGAAAYVRIRPAPEGAEALDLFDILAGTIGARPYVREIKRPVPPR